MSYARKAVTRMTLDMSRVDLQRSETVTLLDTNRRWEVTLTNGGTPFRLPNNWTASLVGVKPDEEEGGSGMMLLCSVVDGRIIFDFDENKQLTTCAGAFPVQFDVWNEYGELVASPKIWLHVLPDVRPHEDLASTGQYTTIGELIAKEQANREDIDKNASDIDVLESARPVTGSFAVGDAMWRKSDDGYTATIELTDNPLRSGDVMLILPDGDETRKASADVVVSVKSAENGDEADAIVLTAKSKPAVTTLWYRYAVIKRGAEDTTMLPVASIVGVHDVPTYVTNWIDRVDKAAASNEQKIDNEVERLDERIDNLPQAGGGISVGRGEFTIPKGDWEDDYPDRAKVVFPAETFVVGDVVIVTPANDETRETANSAGLFIRMAMSGDYEPHDDQIMLARATTGLKPTEDMRFVYAVLHTDSDANALVTLIGVDAAGGSEPTLVDLSRFDPDENGKGYITETYGEGEDATTKEIEVTYDGEGNIVQIGATVIKWTAAGEEG